MPDSSQDSALQAAKEQTKTYAKNLWNTIHRYRKEPEMPKKATSEKMMAPFEHEQSWLLQLLAVIPYLLILLFAFSFFWDFDGIRYTILGHPFYFEGLLRILSVSGLIGFLTNWIAITMLFKPVHKRPLLGHGLIPAQKNRIAFRLAQAVSEDLINPEIIKRKIHESDIISKYRKKSTDYIRAIIDNPSFRADLKVLLVNYIDDMIANPEIRAALAQKILVQIEKSMRETSIERMALKAYTFVKGQKMQQIVEDALTRIPESVETGLDRFDLFLDNLPEKLEANSEQIEEFVTSMLYKLINQLDVHALVEDNLREYDEQRISDIIRKATNEQLRYIQYLGGILGIIGGLVIWEPLVSVLCLTALAVSIFLLDSFLLKLNGQN
ncbi:MAG: DUF445 family protein [Balneolaceae bacterium]|nr:DUF445 family protein [Balneolaceae bacterium]